jgi:hypothetical protein
MKTLKVILVLLIMSLYSCGEPAPDPPCNFTNTGGPVGIYNNEILFPRATIEDYNFTFYNSLFEYSNSLIQVYQEGDLYTGNIAHAVLTYTATSRCYGEHTQEYWVGGPWYTTGFYDFHSDGRGDLYATLKSDLWDNQYSATWENYFYIIWEGTESNLSELNFGMGYIVATDNLSNARQSLIIKPENAFIFSNGIKTPL